MSSEKVTKAFVIRISSTLKYVQDTDIGKIISHTSSYLYAISLSEHLKAVIVRACVAKGVPFTSLLHHFQV